MLMAGLLCSSRSSRARSIYTSRRRYDSPEIARCFCSLRSRSPGCRFPDLPRSALQTGIQPARLCPARWGRRGRFGGPERRRRGGGKRSGTSSGSSGGGGGDVGGGSMSGMGLRARRPRRGGTHRGRRSKRRAAQTIGRRVPGRAATPAPAPRRLEAAVEAAVAEIHPRSEGNASGRSASSGLLTGLRLRAGPSRHIAARATVEPQQALPRTAAPCPHRTVAAVATSTTRSTRPYPWGFWGPGYGFGLGYFSPRSAGQRLRLRGWLSRRPWRLRRRLQRRRRWIRRQPAGTATTGRCA